ncbi:hypothetical protein QQS21_001738 [Conoideocrella luteorostrata]|uniref:Cytochrome P450 n=1 Tax=Conoideocrella luteorostrata TaxID=1105319 RepID=A0AAJ0FXA0_9HYPO|nr:hypothetical protein QQS21_001738 [Conoideocrella luteorostrata]
MKEGARQFPDSPYIVRYSGFEQIVYPSSCLDEVKALGPSQASLMEYCAHCFFEGWALLGREIGALHGILGIDLARSLPARIHERQTVTKAAFDKVVGNCADWKSIRLYPSVQRLVASINGAGLLGPDVGSRPQWLNTFDMFIYSLMFALFSLNPSPRFIRPLFKYVAFAPNYLLYWRLKQIAKPVAERDLRTYHDAVAAGQTKPNNDNPSIGVWLAARYKPAERTVGKLAHDFIVTMFESMPTTSCTLYFILSDLALRPQVADELRTEINANLVDGKLPMTSLGELRKMDSFMREVTWTKVFSYMGVFRRTLKPIQLSIGPQVPAGAVICVDSYNIANSKERWGDPETFNSERFHALRQEPGHESRHQFASLDSDSASWGGGPQACPGRFFAENSIKIFLTHSILNYDIKFPDGVGKPVAGTMPNGSVMPDLMASILIRERSKT